MSDLWISGSCEHGELLEGSAAVCFELFFAVDVRGLNSGDRGGGRMDAPDAKQGAPVPSEEAMSF